MKDAFYELNEKLLHFIGRARLIKKTPRIFRDVFCIIYMIRDVTPSSFFSQPAVAGTGCSCTSRTPLIISHRLRENSATKLTARPGYARNP